MDLERILIIQPVERIVKFEPRITVKSSDTDLTKNWTRALQLKLGTVDEQSATWNIMILFIITLRIKDVDGNNYNACGIGKKFVLDSVHSE